MIPSVVCVWSQATHVPLPTTGPLGVCSTTGEPTPTPAGTARDFPFTKIVSRAWMWKRSCSLGAQAMPSTEPPGEGPPAGAISGPLSSGIPSKPVFPFGGDAFPPLNAGPRCPGGEALPPLLLRARGSPTPSPIATARTAPPMTSVRVEKRGAGAPSFERTAGGLRLASARRCCLVFLPLGIRPHGSRVDLFELCGRVAEAGVHLAQVPLAVPAAQVGVAGEPDHRGGDRVDVVPVVDELSALALLDPLVHRRREADDERDAARHRLEQRGGGGVHVGERHREVGGRVDRRKVGGRHVSHDHVRLELELRSELVELCARPASAGAREEP